MESGGQRVLMEDDGVFIEEEEPEGGRVLNPKLPFTSGNTPFMNVALNYLGDYGWLLLFCTLAGVIFYVNVAQWYRGWVQRRERYQETIRIHRDPDVVRYRMEAMERARIQLQQHHDAAAALHAEEAKRKEQEKQKERLQRLENTLHGKSTRNLVRDPIEVREGNQSMAPIKRKPLRTAQPE